MHVLQVPYFPMSFSFFPFSGFFSLHCCRYFSVFSYTLDCRAGKSCSTTNSQPSPTTADFGWSRLFIFSLNKLPSNAAPRGPSLEEHCPPPGIRAWGVLLQMSHRQPGPQDHVRGPCHCSWLPALFSRILQHRLLSNSQGWKEAAGWSQPRGWESPPRKLMRIFPPIWFSSEKGLPGWGQCPAARLNTNGKRCPHNKPRQDCL